MNKNALWISAFKDNTPVNPELAGILKDIYEGYDPNKLPQDTKAYQFAKDFIIKKPIMSAELKVTACGYFKVYINGFRISRNVLAPSFTDFNKVIYYSTFDITNYIEKENRLGLLIGNGYYNQFEDDTWKFGKAPWRGQTKTIATLTLQYTDGSKEDILTDASWKFDESDIQYQNIRSGEYHDLNLYSKDWSTLNCDISNWKNVYTHGYPNLEDNPKQDPFEKRPEFQTPPYLSKQINLAPCGVLKKEIIKPIKKFSDHEQDAKIISIEKIGEKETLITLDKNTVGWAKFKIKGKKNDIIKFEFIEYNDNINFTKYNFSYNTFQTFEVKLSGKTDICEPKFSYYGFQYIKIYGNYKPQIDDIVIYSVHNDFKKRLDFCCDNEIINKIHEICQRTYILNWQSIPTDCPQREKNGWVADAWLSSEFGLMNYNSLSGYKKWLEDVINDWEVYGEPSPIIPNPCWNDFYKDNKTYCPIWGGFSIMLCKYIFKFTQDKKLIEKYYPYMKAYIYRLHDIIGDDLFNENHGISLGDWCEAQWENCQAKWSNPWLISNMFIVVLLDNIIKLADLLNKREDIDFYNILKSSLIQKINEKWFDYNNNYYSEKSMTSLALGLYYNIVPMERYKNCSKNLIKMINNYDNKINCGIIGTWIIFDTLTKLNEKEKALKILLNEDYPSFGYILKQGATTLWETWEGNDSRNHPMFGSVDAWIIKNIGGLNYINGEYIFNVPNLKEIHQAKVSVKTKDGLITCSWEKTNDKYFVNIESPNDISVTLKFDSIPNYEEKILSEDRTVIKYN